MDRESVKTQIERTVAANDGKPLSTKAFFERTNLTESALQRAGLPDYPTALEAFGYQRNERSQLLSDDQLFEPLAQLVRRLGRFPKRREFRVERYQNDSFPGGRNYSRRGKQEPLDIALVNWARTKESFQDVVRILDSASSTKKRDGIAKRPRKIINGYVYLMRYGRGKDYKIGFTENVARREAQLDMISPSDVRIVWKIETDDPKGIEEYWHKRFKDRRLGTKEVFRLTAEDIAAFKRRKYQ
jgi:hypothetical protein